MAPREFSVSSVVPNQYSRNVCNNLKKQLGWADGLIVDAIHFTPENVMEIRCFVGKGKGATFTMPDGHTEFPLQSDLAILRLLRNVDQQNG